MTESTPEAMVRLGGLYAAGRTGWSHYDGCPVAHGMDDTDEDCCCDEIEREYDDERSEW